MRDLDKNQGKPFAGMLNRERRYRRRGRVPRQRGVLPEEMAGAEAEQSNRG